MEVGIVAAFVAGLVSFLSPCVLPLVPGYISMLSGIGVEQLKQGQAPRGGLLISALAFVIGFSVVFIAFGASASAVGAFLLKNKTLLAPVAGAVIILFGLHLLDWLRRVPIATGLVIGGVLVAVGAALHWSAAGSAPAQASRAAIQPIHLYSLALIFLAGPSLSRW